MPVLVLVLVLVMLIPIHDRTPLTPARPVIDARSTVMVMVGSGYSGVGPAECGASKRGAEGRRPAGVLRASKAPAN